VGDAGPSVPLHQVCLVLSIAPSLYSVLLSHCTRSVTQALVVSKNSRRPGPAQVVSHAKPRQGLAKPQ
jgi:hypothetical protein